MVLEARSYPKAFAGASKLVEAPEHQCWFTKDEICRFDRIRLFHITPCRPWILMDATQSKEVDSVRIAACEKYICISKRIEPQTGCPAYDITSTGMSRRTEHSIAAAALTVARYLQISNRLDAAYENIQAQIFQDQPTLK